MKRHQLANGAVSHRLRVHCLAAGHPIVGDSLYGPAATEPRLCLHAAVLELPHPETGELVVFRSPGEELF